MNIINTFKKAAALGLFFGIGLTGYAQQYPTFTDYGYNPYMINSAYSGLVKTPEIYLSYNGVASQANGSPQTLSLSAMMPFTNKNFALGASYVSDRIGVTSINSAKVSYAYRLNFTEDENVEDYKQNSLQNHSLSFGIDGGVRFMNDQLLNLGMGADPRLGQNVSAKVATLGVSVVYNHPDFFVGLTAENLLGDKLSENDNLLYVEQPYYAYAGYRFFVGDNHSMIITPNIFVKHNFKTPIIVDYNVNMNFRGNFDVDVGYRNVGAVSVSAGVRVLEHFRLMYSFNNYTKANYFNNSHGIMINYQF